MLARVFTMRFNPVTGDFSDEPMQSFIKYKEVLSIRDHFFVKDDIPYLTLIVTFNMHPLAEAGIKTTGSGHRDESWRELITEAEAPFFNALRTWHSERCKKEGIPPYVICTNSQLAVMVKSRPKNITELLEVEGFGRARQEKYGADLLAIFSRKEIVPSENGSNPIAIRTENHEVGE